MKRRLLAAVMIPGAFAAAVLAGNTWTPGAPASTHARLAADTSGSSDDSCSYGDEGGCGCGYDDSPDACTPEPTGLPWWMQTSGYDSSGGPWYGN